MNKLKIITLSIMVLTLTVVQANQHQEELFKSQVYAELFNQHGGDWAPFLKRPEKKNKTIDFLIERVRSPQHYLHQVSVNDQLELVPSSILALSFFLYNSKENSYHPTVKAFYQSYDDKFNSLENETKKLILHCYYNSRSPLGLNKLVSYMSHPEQRVAQEATRLIQSLKDRPSEQAKTSLTQNEIVYNFSENPKIWSESLKNIRRKIEIGIKNKNILYNSSIVRALKNITNIQKRNKFILPFGVSTPTINQNNAKRNELSGTKKVDSSYNRRKKLHTKTTVADVTKRLKEERKRQKVEVSKQFVSLADRQPASSVHSSKKKNSSDYIWYGILGLAIFLIINMLLWIRQKK